MRRLAYLLVLLAALAFVAPAQASAETLHKHELRHMAKRGLSDFALYLTSRDKPAPNHVSHCRLTSEDRGLCRGKVRADDQTCQMQVVIREREFDYVMMVRRLRCR